MGVCGAARQPGTTRTASPRPALPAARWPPPPRLSWRTADRAFGQPSHGSSFPGAAVERHVSRRVVRVAPTGPPGARAGACISPLPCTMAGQCRGCESARRRRRLSLRAVVAACRVPLRVEPRGEGRRMWWRRDGHPHVRRQWCLVPRRRRAVWIKRRAVTSDGSTLGRRVFNAVSAPRGGIGWRGARDRRPLCPPLRLRPAGPPTRHRGPPRPPAGHTP